MFYQSWGLHKKLVVGGIGIVLLVVACIVVLFDQPDQSSKNQQTVAMETPATSATKKTEQKKETQVMVDVKGAVKRPGVYQVAEHDRVYQAIQAAGGFLKQADQKQVNLAQKCQDEMVIYVPVQGEPVPTSLSTTPTTQGQERINLNTASQEELEGLDGIGPAKAEAIIKYRDTHGRFQSIDQVTQVPGIGEKTVDLFREQVSI